MGFVDTLQIVFKEINRRLDYLTGSLFINFYSTCDFEHRNQPWLIGIFIGLPR